ncbi:acetyl coenzyme A synthetase (ADP forming)-like protein [Methanomicrobium sp. W14]|uniref:acetate--CoA ligase family protein n=1 Tax=Methanomicrobium sp. W14 TaxID=2817839 RepID=UPI001AE3D1C7|nr:acetate--CoA ligase family protein [Methanomicrobium sp. W14]MBP2132123.1 acetyl coenzyme A synthetase (ADP forming)-like protein [Methanomicrobium sp. W14]
MARWMLSESEGYDFLKKYDVPVPEYSIVKSPAEAGKEAERIGYPVVMKIVSPQILHKSDAGGVIVGVKNNEEAEEAYRQIISNVEASKPDADIEGVIVEAMAKPGVELIIGGNTDSTFGKTITFGIGGTLVEFLKDVSMRILPIDEDEVRKMVREINSYKLITGYRGSAPKDEEILVRTIMNVCRAFEETDDLKEFDINPLRLYESGACAVDTALIFDDDHENGADGDVPVDLNIFDPKSIAVIGASETPGKMGYAVMHKLSTFPGKLYPVNPKRDVIMCFKTYPTILDIPEDIDMAVITVPSSLVPGIMEECGKKGVKIAVVITAGFREMNDEGRRLEEDTVSIAKKYGTRIVGPNCLGIINPHKGYDTTYVQRSPAPGSIAFLSQSGAIVNAVVDWSLTHNIGFSVVVSVGNQSDLNFFDYLRWAESDPNTEAIIMYIEEINRGRKFLDLVSRISKTKPVVAIKSGSSERGRAAAASHTGSLAGSYEVYMEAFRESGILSVTNLEDAFLAAEFLSHNKQYPKGRRAVIVTNAGGFAVLSNDYAERYGVDIIDLPKEVIEEMDQFLPPFWNRGNPIDLLGDADGARFAKTFNVLAKHDDLWDICMVIGFPNLVLTSERFAKQIMMLSESTEKRVVSVLIGGAEMNGGREILRENKVPPFEELETAFRVVGRTLQSKYRVKGVGLL